MNNDNQENERGGGGRLLQLLICLRRRTHHLLIQSTLFCGVTALHAFYQNPASLLHRRDCLLSASSPAFRFLRYHMSTSISCDPFLWNL